MNFMRNTFYNTWFMSLKFIAHDFKTLDIVPNSMRYLYMFGLFTG